MRALPGLLHRRAALGALRRSLPAGAPTVVACRSPRGLRQVLETRLVDAIVLGVRATRRVDLGALRADYPGIPVVGYGAIRSDDDGLLLEWPRLPERTG